MCYAYPGPRCSSHARKARQEALAHYIELVESKEDTKTVEEAQKKLLEANTSYDSTPAGQKELAAAIDSLKTAEASESDIAILEKRLAIGKQVREDALEAFHKSSMASLVEGEDPTKSAAYLELEQELQERIDRPEFIGLIAERDRTREEKQNLHAEIKAQKEYLERLEKIAEGRVPGTGEDKPTLEEIGKAQDALDDEYEKMRELNSKHLDAYYAYHLANNELEQYKDETALVVAAMNDIAGDPGIPYEGSKLGNCVEVASYDSGTREWLEERQNGIGGSDVGSMLKLDPDYGTENFIDFVKSKTERYSEEEVAAQAEANSGFSGPTGRGNAWETAIVRRYMEENPDQAVMYSKSSWANKDNPHHKANVDGLLSSDGGKTPDGILEIKTASDMSHWEHVNADGSIEERVPLGYRAQVLWYLRQTGFQYADIAVIVDDREYRSRRIFADEPINPYESNEDGDSAVGPIEYQMPKIERIWQDEVVARRNGTRPVRSLKSDFEDSHKSDKIHNQAVQLAAWRQIEISEATAIIKKHRKESLSDWKNASDDYEPPTLTERITNEYRKGGPTTWKKDLVSVDIETSGMGPNSGEIIEIGIRRTRPDGTIVEEYAERFGVRNDKALDVLGTGAQEVHKIAPDDIRGKRSFEHPEVQAKVKKFLMDDNAIMVAHNKAFEERWFDQYVPGFRKHRARLTTARFKAKREGVAHPEPKSIMDTMFHARYLTPETPNNKLATFTEANGVPYLDAHSALPDAQMTQRAVYNHDRKLRGVPIIDERPKAQPEKAA